MMTFARVSVLVERGAIEVRESVCVTRKVCGDPIEYHSDVVLMEVVDAPPQVVGSAVPRGGCEKSGDLITP